MAKQLVRASTNDPSGSLDRFTAVLPNELRKPNRLAGTCAATLDSGSVDLGKDCVREDRNSKSESG